MSNNTNNTNNERNNGQWGSWLSMGAAGVAAAAAIGGIGYLLSGRSESASSQEGHSQNGRSQRERQQRATPRPAPNPSPPPSTSSYLTDMVSRIMLASTTDSPRPQSVTVTEVPIITNLNSLLSDIYLRYIRLKEFSIHYKVFDGIFQDLHKKMKQVDPYYKKYSSTVQFAGSHFDNLRIKKPDEFDMDIVISLPLNIKPNLFNTADSDIVLEPKAAGFVQLKMGVQFQQLPMRDNEEWLINKAAFKWMDCSNYLQRSKFIQWFESVVIKALNLYEVRSNGRPVVYVDGVPYIIELSKSGPAMTLLIHNASKSFKMDVDLVPALKFPESRWPISSAYRNIPPKCRKDYWMVVPKPNKESPFEHDQSRSWRIALHNQERELMHDSNNLRQAIRLIKKLRDAQDMKKIASYYIKTLFFWEIEDINDQTYWRNSVATLFKRMVGKLHQALVVGKIPYYWNKNNNLIGGVPRDTLTRYANKLVPLMTILEEPSNYKLVAKYLLTTAEFADYNAKYLHI